LCEGRRSRLAAQIVAQVRRYNPSMSAERIRLHALVDALPDSEVQTALALLGGLGDEEVIDTVTTAKLDLARAEPGEDTPMAEIEPLA
jgi:hypothetical protein